MSASNVNKKLHAGGTGTRLVVLHIVNITKTGKHCHELTKLVFGYSGVHFTPLIWSVCLLAEGMDVFQLLGQTVIDQSMSLKKGLSLKLTRNNHHLKALATPTRRVLHLLQNWLTVEGAFCKFCSDNIGCTNGCTPERFP